MRTVIPIGASVRLVPVSEIALGLRMPYAQACALLARLNVPVTIDYGPEDMVSLAALEGAIFRDTWIVGDHDSDSIRLYQLQAAIDYGVLDRAALQKKLRQFTAEIYKIHERHDSEDNSDDQVPGAGEVGPTRPGQRRNRSQSG